MLRAAGRGGVGRQRSRGQVGYQVAEGGEIQAGPLHLLSVILPSTERALKGAGPEGIFFFSSEQAFLPIMIYEDRF